MKKFLNFLLMCMFALVAFITTSCDRLGKYTQTKDNTTNVVTVEDKIICPFDPEFTTTEQVMEFRQRLAEEYELDSVMLVMPENVLLNVASVCEKKMNKFKRRQLVDEYLKNKDIYNNLSNKTNAVKTTSTMEESRITPEPPEKLVLSEYKDTIINGKKHRIEKRLIEYKDGN